jgi:tetratricopeptide (TPR) repeat protein
MTLTLAQLLRVGKRLTQAAGYLELQMPQQALASLESLGPLGPFEAEVEFLRGHALRMEHRYREAARKFKLAAQKLPSQKDEAAWVALAQIYHQIGTALKGTSPPGRARGANPPGRA